MDVAEDFDPDKLWDEMRAHNVSPRQLVADLGISSRTLGAWLAGTAYPKNLSLHALAKALGVKEHALITQQREGK